MTHRKTATISTSRADLSCARNGLNPTARSVDEAIGIVCRMNESRFVLIEDRGRVRYLTLSQPERKNAVPDTGWDEIADALDDFGDSGQRVLVIRGAQGNFCSGADLNVAALDELRSPSVGHKYMQAPGRAATALHRLPKPTLAAVDGIAVGAGMNLAIGCDIVVATARAQFAELFVHRGLALDFGGTWLLPRIVGMARARELALTGRMIDAEEALSIGLISRVVGATELAATVDEIAQQLADGAPLAQRFIKIGLSRSIDLTFEQAIAYEDQAQAALLASNDLREGIKAFLNKRDPEFRGL